MLSFFFFFNDTPTTEIYTLPLHDALPISPKPPISEVATRVSRSTFHAFGPVWSARLVRLWAGRLVWLGDRKSTRLNSSHSQISYAVFCLKKKKKNNTPRHELSMYHVPIVD